MDLKTLSNDELKKLVQLKKIKVSDLIDAAICPTCFDKENNNILYGDKSKQMLYEDELFECFLVSNPRSIGHTVISTKNHYKDMLEIDDELCKKIFVLAKKVMQVLKDVYKVPSVYLCTMCDGPMNHFHIQLIPRENSMPRGSKNFVRERSIYIYDKEKIEELRKRIGEKNGNK